MERDQASKFIDDLLRLMISRGGSDLFITADFPPAIKVDGQVVKVAQQQLSAAHTLALVRSVMNDKQVAEFERTKECNFALSPAGIGRFRVPQRRPAKAACNLFAVDRIQWARGSRQHRGYAHRHRAIPSAGFG